jgi:hypothetical protein
MRHTWGVARAESPTRHGSDSGMGISTGLNVFVAAELTASIVGIESHAGNWMVESCPDDEKPVLRSLATVYSGTSGP